MEVKQGDIFWYDFGEPRASEPGYRHPVVVVQNNIFNKSRISTTVVCAITSNVTLAAAPGNVFLRKGEANLSKSCVINISQIETINKSDLIDKIGTLSKAHLFEVIAGLRLLTEPRNI